MAGLVLHTTPSRETSDVLSAVILGAANAAVAVATGNAMLA
ncbi:MAG: hypothetical protein QOK49_4273 [Baekduia sp.]|jgi:hypothetical protein|nr:hypothetical protein [Baekduia sp.]